MKSLIKSLSAITLSLAAATAFSAPTHLVTHNNTNENSNAYIAGTVPSPHPTAPMSTNKVYWNLVKIACFPYKTPDGKCTALIKMATNTSSPVEVGTVTMDLNSGAMTPSEIRKNGYVFTVNGPGEASISYGK